MCLLGVYVGHDLISDVYFESNAIILIVFQLTFVRVLCSSLG